MKLLFRTSFSDYFLLEIFGIVIATFIASLTTAYVVGTSIYKASIVGGEVIPILGVQGHLSVQNSEKSPEYYANKYFEIKERIASLFGKFVWSNINLLSTAYTIVAFIFLFPFVYRMRISLVPLLFREPTSLVHLVLKGLILSFLFLLPLYISILAPIIIVSKFWLSGAGFSYILLLSSILISLLILLTVTVYSTYLVWGRGDLTVFFTLLLAFGFSSNLDFNWKSVLIYLGASMGIVLVLIMIAHRRVMKI
ncbi:hypothetical protein [Pyrococcus kukulkanii]|uniref:Uncharacterized protein n=1 Tax=Pyrococcus kukulkanii TaxID=1609559 RepID=A0A127B8S6_9EURY|nr:hypothetical protein [Pyrococcus kukulkanii]AMM53761.1 hypothetical protein TQ32_04135 [Pyrococcus kukulkanii]